VCKCISLRNLVRRFAVLAISTSVLLVSSRAQQRVRSSSEVRNASDQFDHLGYPQDWSARHLLLTGSESASVQRAGVHEPRQVYNLVRRMVAEDNLGRGIGPPRIRSMKVDWSVSLENGFVSPNQFPAKYRFNVTAEDCNSDYALFALQIAPGMPAQANIVGINNLYTEASPKCNSGVPWVAFAYNSVTHAGGQILTSPVLSMDGRKAAFVESTATGSYFHVLVLPGPIPVPPSQTGTVLAPTTPISCSPPVTANCMSTLTISAAANSLSSPWIDYDNDVAYVGTDDGKLYKISPVFGGGAPALSGDTTNWPVTVITSGTSNVLTAPVLDIADARIFLGDGNGYLYAINTIAPAKTISAKVTIGWVGHGPGTGIVDPPIVVNDIANPATNQVFSFTGCSNLVGFGGAVNQIPATFSSSTGFTTVDMGSAEGLGSCTTGNVHGGQFDDAFWNSGTTSGHLIACGFVSGTTSAQLVPSNPKMYMFGFDSSHLITSTTQKTWVVNNSKGDECSPLTEFSDGTTDRIFFGVGGLSDGFIKSSSITASLPVPSTCGSGSPTSTCVTAPNILGGTSGIVIDNQVSNGGTNIYFTTLAPGSVNGQNCKVTGGVATPYCAVKLTQAALQ
jgi:hypothetical protein